MSKALHKHYYEIIACCCFFILFINQGFPSTSFGVYQSYLVKLEGVGDIGSSTVLTVRTAVSFLAIFTVDWYYRHLTARSGVALATVCTALGFLLYGLAGNNLIILCAGSVCAGIGYGVGGVVASTMLIGRWYQGDIGTAAGIAGAGSGMAGMIMPTLVAWIVGTTNLSVAFFVQAGIAVTVAVLLLVFLRSNPSDIGLSPFLVQKKPSTGRLGHLEAQAQQDEKPTPMSKRQQRMMVIAMVFMGANAVVANYTFAVLCSSSGINLTVTALLTSLLGAALFVARYGSGKLFDIIGTVKGSVVFFVLLIAGDILCVFIPLGGVVLAAIAAVLYGLGRSLSTTGLAVWSLELSSPEEHLKTTRTLTIAYSFGGMVFNPLPGILKTATGTYASSFVVFSLCGIGCAALVLYVYAHRLKQSKPCQE